MNQDKLKVLQKSKSNLIYYGKVISPDTFYLPSPPFHTKVSSLLINMQIKKGLIIAPRGTAKSALSVKSVHHHYTFDNVDKDSVIVIQSKTRKEAVKRLWSIKNTIEYNNVYKGLFGYHGKEMSEIWREDYIKFKYNGHWVTIGAIGTGQQVRGILEGDTRVTYYLLDDPEDEDNTATTDQMDKNYDKFLAGLATLDKRGSICRVIGTPIVQDCLVDRIQTNPSGWTVQSYNAKTDMLGNPGLLWKEMYSYEDLKEIEEDYKSKDKLRKYYADYECTVKGAGEEFFKREYLQYWDGKVEFIGDDAYLKITHLGNSLENLLELDIPIIMPVNIFLGVDPAASSQHNADFTVIMPIAFDARRNIYVLPYFRRREPPTAVAEALVEYIKALKPTRVHVESNLFKTYLSESVKDRLLKEDNLSISGLNNKYLAIGNKEERLETLHHFFANKKVFFCPDTYGFIKELVMFGTKRGHDDTLDGFYWATRKLIPPVHTLEKSEPAELTDDEIMEKARKLFGLKNKKLEPKGYLAA